MLDLRPYAARWIALVAGRVAGFGRTPSAARQMASSNRPKERSQIGFVVPGSEGELLTELPLDPLLATLRPLLASSVEPVYLVGGAVRDALLGMPGRHDLDFATCGDAVQLGRLVADALGGAFYILDSDRGTARVILEKAVLDFARFRAETLLADLRARDFTINSIALPVDSDAIDAIIDPLGGQDDLAAGVVRATGPTALEDDPVRGLRAVRQAAELDAQITPQTLRLIREASRKLASVSAERVRDEFCRLLVAPDPANSIGWLDELGLLETILPELTATKGITQSLPHRLDVFAHTLAVLEQLDSLLNVIMLPNPPEESLPVPIQGEVASFAQQLSAHVGRPTAGNRNGRMLLSLGALLHDVGKAHTRSVDADGTIRFHQHEQHGAEMARNRARAMALSSSEARQVAVIVQGHMRPAWLGRSSPEGEPSRRSIYRFFRDTGSNGLDICLLSLAEGLVTRSDPEEEGWTRRSKSIITLLDHFLNRRMETITPPLLLTGSELMAALDLTEGPEVGELLQLIQEAQAAGEVSTTDGAVTLAREVHRSASSD